jgi:glycosyltransferase involved in cell wall biosynthesis
MKERILIISNYYPPEIGAAANRIKNLAEGLTQLGKEVTVICPLPNYPKGVIFRKYKGKFKVTEIINEVIVKRYWLYPSSSKNSMIRVFSMLSFSFTIWSSVFSFFKKKPNLCIIQSPPLFVAMSGLLLSKVIQCKSILNVSDLWPLSALELGVIQKGKFYSLLKKIELLNYKLADKIIGQSNEIIEHVSCLVKKEFLVYRNTPVYKKHLPKHKEKGELSIVYAGLLGYAQGIDNICKNINFKELNVEFHIYGDGMEKQLIIDYSKDTNRNIFFHGSISATEVKEKIRKYDIALVPLKNRIQGAVPSKLFELMQLGVPILYTTCEGEAKSIIKENNLGFVSESNNYKSLKHTILKFKNLDDDEFLMMSNNCLKMHEKEYRLDYQLKNLISYINNEN